MSLHAYQVDIFSVSLTIMNIRIFTWNEDEK